MCQSETEEIDSLGRLSPGPVMAAPTPSARIKLAPAMSATRTRLDRLDNAAELVTGCQADSVLSESVFAESVFRDFARRDFWRAAVFL